MPERKNDEIALLNAKKLLILHLYTGNCSKGVYFSLCDLFWCIFEEIIYKNMVPGRVIIKPFSGVVFTIVFGVNIFSKYFLIHLSWKPLGR